MDPLNGLINGMQDPSSQAAAVGMWAHLPPPDPQAIAAAAAEQYAQLASAGLFAEPLQPLVDPGAAAADAAAAAAANPQAAAPAKGKRKSNAGAAPKPKKAKAAKPAAAGAGDAQNHFPEIAAAEAAAAAAAGGPAAQTGPAGGDGAAAQAATWKAVAISSVSGATYSDQSLEFARLNDGRELLLAGEIWEITPPNPPVMSPASVTKIGAMKGDRFAFIPGADVVAVVKINKLTFYALPGNEEVGSITLPGLPETYSFEEGVRFVSAVPGALLCVSMQYAFLVSLGHIPNEAAAAAAAAAGDLAAIIPAEFAATLALVVNLSEGALGQVLDAEPAAKLASKPAVASTIASFARTAPRVSAASLWVDPAGAPHAVLGSRGRVVVAPLMAGGLDGRAAVDIAPRVVQAHNSLNKWDDASVNDLALWRRPGGGSAAITVGGDGNIAITPLDDGVVASTTPYPVASWHVTKKEKTPAHRLAINTSAGVAFTGTQYEICGSFWDLSSGQRLCKTRSLAKFHKGPEKVRLQSVAFNSAGSMLAYTNSNDANDDVLKICRPVYK